MTRAEEPVSPLERLKQRSAESRWTEMKESLLLKQSELKAFGAESASSQEASPLITGAEASGVPVPADDLGTWRTADEAPLPQLKSLTGEHRLAPAATTPAPDGLGSPAVASGSVAPPFPEELRGSLASEVQSPVNDANRAVNVNTVAGTDTGLNRDAPRKHLGVPDPYASREATLAEISLPATGRDSAENLPDHRPLKMEHIFPEQAGAQPLIMPDPAQYVSELPSPERFALPPAPMRVAQNGDLPQPLPEEDRDVYYFRPITEIDPSRDYSPAGPQAFSEGDVRTRSPKVLPLPVHGTTVRTFAPTQFQWEAANVFHNPLYFEDVELERYGHAYPWGLQPAASLAKFGVQFIGLPYTMAMDPMWDEQYALGYYRPGDCAPKLHYQIPLDKKAAITAAGVYTGLFFIFP